MKQVCLSPTEIEERLRSKGIQPTLQRIAICRHVLCEAEHPTAEDVHAWAEKNLTKISLATVYNTLNTLVEAELLREFRFGHSEKVIYDNNIEDHFHFLDERTNKLYDIAPDDVRVDLAMDKSFQVKRVDILFKGTLKDD